MGTDDQIMFREHQATINDESIAVTDTGDGEVTLVFIHGSFIDKDYWQQQVAAFSTDYRVITYDLAGHGHSSYKRETYTIDDYGKDLLALIQVLNLRNIILVGHSIGADIMLLAANDPKVIGLIAVDYFKNAGVQLPDQEIDGIMSGLQDNFADTNEQYARNALLSGKTNESITNRVVADFRNMNKKVGIPMNNDFFHFPETEKRLLGNLDKKLFLINVDFQPTDESKISQLLKRGYNLQSMQGTCHFPMIENPVELNQHLKIAIGSIIAQK